jgi:hypothetical protein
MAVREERDDLGAKLSMIHQFARVLVPREGERGEQVAAILLGLAPLRDQPVDHAMNQADRW